MTKTFDIFSYIYTAYGLIGIMTVYTEKLEGFIMCVCNIEQDI